MHAAGSSIADDFPKVGSNDLIAIGLVNAVIYVVRSSPSPTSPEARIGSMISSFERSRRGAVGSSDGLIEGSESLPSLGLCQSRVLGLCRQSFFSGLSLSLFLPFLPVLAS